MRIRYLGHGCFHIEMGGKDLIIDPFISGNEMAHSIDIDALSADYILLTHGHMDHVLDAERIAKRNDATIVSNYEIATWYGEKGIKHHPMNHGGKWKFDFGTVKYVNAIHSSVLPDGTYGGNPGGFVIWDQQQCIYIAGDTALSMDMKLIPMTCPKVDVAILPIGDNFTMDIDDAVLCSTFVECTDVIGCHFDTFGFIKINKDEAREKFSRAGKQLTLLDIGETIER